GGGVGGVPGRDVARGRPGARRAAVGPGGPDRECNEGSARREVMRDNLSRRDWLRLTSLGFAGASMSGWLENLAGAAAAHPARKKACILLWMAGGPTQMDTFDLKPGNKNGGPYKEIATAAPGVKISEHLPKIAKHTKRMAIIRSMQTKEADHQRGTYLMRTGRAPGGPVHYPTLGSLV